MDIIQIGFGIVGQGLATILHQHADHLADQYGLTVRIVGVVTRSRGTVYNPRGLPPGELLDAAAQGDLSTMAGATNFDGSTVEFIHTHPADVLVEASPSDLQTAQPALNYCYAAIESGNHVVLANKGPVALDLLGLRAKAADYDRQVLFEATVMAGTPAIRTALEGLAGSGIMAARGILNGTTNFILTEMGNGMPYADALKLAQDKGYAETDPTADVDGWDAAGKVAILSAALFGRPLSLDAMDVRGISRLTVEDIEAASQVGERWRLIAEVTPEGGRVAPMRLPITDPLANVSGATNAITYQTELMGDVTLVGAGAGRVETGYALLADLLSLHRA